MNHSFISLLVSLTLSTLYIMVMCNQSDPELCPVSSPCTCDGNKINCDNNSLIEIPKFKKINTTFQGWYIDFNSNKITDIPSKAFINISVSSLSMSKNLLTYVADDAFEGSENFINWLHLQYNNLDHVPIAVGKLFKLMSLSLQYNPIKIVPDEIMKNLSTNLQFLSIGSREMTEWPRAIRFLKALNFPTFYSLPMSDIPEDAFRGLEKANMYLLDFESTNFVRLPKALGVLRNTTGLVLTNNTKMSSSNIKRDSLKGMMSLQELSVGFCSWTEVPDFSELPSLTDIELTNCPISRWVAETSQQYSSINRVTLDKTDIRTIPSIISQFKNLSSLSLFGTKITEIMKNDFAGLTKLGVLTLSYSPVHFIEQDAFQDNKGMVYLMLDNLKLNGFPRAIRNIPAMKYLNLENNTIICSCSAMGFMKGWSGIGRTFVGGECSNQKMQINEFLLNHVNNCP